MPPPVLRSRAVEEGRTNANNLPKKKKISLHSFILLPFFSRPPLLHSFSASENSMHIEKRKSKLADCLPNVARRCFRNASYLMRWISCLYDRREVGRAKDVQNQQKIFLKFCDCQPHPSGPMTICMRLDELREKAVNLPRHCCTMRRESRVTGHWQATGQLIERRMSVEVTLLPGCVLHLAKYSQDIFFYAVKTPVPVLWVKASERCIHTRRLRRTGTVS